MGSTTPVPNDPHEAGLLDDEEATGVSRGRRDENRAIEVPRFVGTTVPETTTGGGGSGGIEAAATENVPRRAR